MEKNRLIFISMLTMMVAGIMLGFFVSSLSSSGYPLQKHIAFLFVGRDLNKDSIRIEKEMQEYLDMRRDSAGILAKDLPVLSYHFNKDNEKEACQANFMIKEEDLPFIGIVELDDKEIPEMVISRLNKVKHGDERLVSFFDEGSRILKSGKVGYGKRKASEGNKKE